MVKRWTRVQTGFPATEDWPSWSSESWDKEKAKESECKESRERVMKTYNQRWRRLRTSLPTELSFLENDLPWQKIAGVPWIVAHVLRRGGDHLSIGCNAAESWLNVTTFSKTDFLLHRGTGGWLACSVLEAVDFRAASAYALPLPPKYSYFTCSYPTHLFGNGWLFQPLPLPLPKPCYHQCDSRVNCFYASMPLCLYT